MDAIEPKWINGMALAQRWGLDFFSLSQISQQYEITVYCSCSNKDYNQLARLYLDNRKHEIISLLKTRFIGRLIGHKDLLEKFYEIDNYLGQIKGRLHGYEVISEFKHEMGEILIKIDSNTSYLDAPEELRRFFFAPIQYAKGSAQLKRDTLQALFFKMEDIKYFEKEHGKPKLQIKPDFDYPTRNFSKNKIELIPGNIQKDNLSSNEARELGRLKLEKTKWDDSISAALKIGLLCGELQKEGLKITRARLADEIFKLGFKDLPNTTVDKIWKAIPERFRKQAGRPAKEKNSK